MALRNTSMQSRPSTNEDGSQAAPENRPCSAAVWLWCPTMENRFISGLDAQTEGCKDEEAEDQEHHFTH